MLQEVIYIVFRTGRGLTNQEFCKSRDGCLLLILHGYNDLQLVQYHFEVCIHFESLNVKKILSFSAE